MSSGTTKGKNKQFQSSFFHFVSGRSECFHRLLKWGFYLSIDLCSDPQLSPENGVLQQEYWSGLPFPPLGDLPDPGIEPMSPAVAGRFLTTEPQRKPLYFKYSSSSIFYSFKSLPPFFLFPPPQHQSRQTPETPFTVSINRSEVPPFPANHSLKAFSFLSPLKKQK